MARKPVDYSKAKEPTFISRVERTLNEADDFLTVHRIISLSGLTHNRVTASLHHLYKSGAVAFIEGDGGVSYWYATPDTDKRQIKHEVRRHEEPGTRKRIGRGLRKPKVERLAQELIAESVEATLIRAGETPENAKHLALQAVRKPEDPK